MLLQVHTTPTPPVALASPTKANPMKHEPIKLGETHPDYPCVHTSGAFRVIACKDAIQYIVQKRKGTQWHNQGYYMNWDVLVRHWPALMLPEPSPCLLKREQRQRAILSGMTGPSSCQPKVGS